jgi:serine beta-lactamase-like protein LACTB
MVMRLLRFLLLLIVVALFSCKPTKQGNQFEFAIQEGSRMLDSLVQYGSVPGIDVAVAVHGDIVWSNGFGYADLEHKAPVLPGKTRFRIGSVSKPLTAAAMGRLVDAGKMNLDDTVQAYVPYFPTKRFPITIRKISGHLAGIRHYRGQEFLNTKSYPSVESGIAIFSGDSLLFHPGERFSYSSYGYNLLSAAVEGASGSRFLKFMQSEVFDVLQMNNTAADKPDSIIMHRTSFYEVDSLGVICNAPYVDNSYKWAGGGFLSTTSDLVKFGTAHMQGGYLSAGTLEEFTTSQRLNNGETTGYGVGWATIDEGTMKGYGHGGGSVGGITVFNVYPDHGMVLVILSNSSDTDFGTIPERISRLFAESME